MKRFLFLMLLGLPVSTFAHDLNDELAEPASSTDYLMVYCSADGSISADKLYFQLSNDSPANAPLVSAQIAKDSFATNVTDLISGDSTPSRAVEVNGGAGAYRITVNKNGVGKVNYSFVYHCESNQGDHAGTDTVSLQDQ